MAIILTISKEAYGVITLAYNEPVLAGVLVAESIWMESTGFLVFKLNHGKGELLAITRIREICAAIDQPCHAIND